MKESLGTIVGAGAGLLAELWLGAEDWGWLGLGRAGLKLMVCFFGAVLGLDSILNWSEWGWD